MTSHSPASYLDSLNPAQRQAVQASSESSLQILAGPGSGKTRVLTCRVAYLIQHDQIDPTDLVVVTFTNKAANEMKHRLYLLLGPLLADRIVMGTFHGVCVRFLRTHGSKLGLKSNWVICDRDQQLAYCKAVLSQPDFKLKNDALPIKFKPNTLLNYVSKCKSKGDEPTSKEKKLSKPDEFLLVLFKAYEIALRDDNCLDFDDLLTYGERLIRLHPQVISHVQHVLIDEFQDTNLVQYEMMKHLAHRGAVTIVGDPDQGIYGWRNAEIGNLKRMEQDIKNTRMIFLEENYRSSSRILNASLAVVQQDKKRINKSLFTTHPNISLPVLRPFQKPQEEADFIAQEIERIIAQTGGQLNYNDFAILLRYNALSRSIEAALQSAGIPSRMVGGQKFFDRAEVKDILAYLQLADNPSFVPAFERIINVPKRAIGVSTVKVIKEAAKSRGISPMEILINFVKGRQDHSGLNQSHRSKFKTFLAVIYKIQTLARDGSSIVEIIDTLVDQVDYVGYLQKTHGPDAVHRHQNVEELKAFAVHLDGGESPQIITPPVVPGSPGHPNPRTTSKRDIEAMMVGMESNAPREDGDEEPSALRRFLTESMLSTDTETEESKANSKDLPKVTISTCHASKGLEWPVVFIPAVEDGTLPFYLCVDEEAIKEERRLLFVAMTRAQGLLYLSHCHNRMAGAENREQNVSQFVSSLKVKRRQQQAEDEEVTFSHFLPDLNLQMRQELSKVIGRAIKSDEEVDNLLSKYNEVTRREFAMMDSNQSTGKRSNDRWGSSSQANVGGKMSYGYNRWGDAPPPPSMPAGRFVSSSSSSQPLPEKVGFQSAYSLVNNSMTTTKSAPNGFVPPSRSLSSGTTATTPVGSYGYNKWGTIPPPPPGPSSSSSQTSLRHTVIKGQRPGSRMKMGAFVAPTVVDKFSEVRSGGVISVDGDGKKNEIGLDEGFKTISSSFMDHLKRSIPNDDDRGQHDSDVEVMKKAKKVQTDKKKKAGKEVVEKRVSGRSKKSNKKV